MLEAVTRMRYDLKNGLPENFVYAASTVVSYRREFAEEAEGLVNARIELEDPKAAYRDYEYISVVEKERVKLPVELEVECSFDKFGAPLIVFSEEITEKENGWKEYGEHYEVVLFESGINIWHITPKKEGGQQAEAVCKARLPFPAGQWTKMKVKLTREGIEAQAGELTAKGEAKLPERMYAGFTACEGINHFRYYSREEI